MRIFGFLLILFMFLGCEDRLGDTTVKSLSGKSYRSDQSLQFRTNLIKDFNTNGSTLSVDLGNHFVVDGGIFYTTNHPLFGDELFYWDQASGEAHLVEDLNFGGAGSNIRKLKRFGNYVYFFATTASEGTELRRVSISNPYSIETFDIVPGLGMIPTVDAEDPVLTVTNYYVINNKAVVYNYYEGIEVIDLNTLELTTLSEDQGFPASSIDAFYGDMTRLNDNLYFVMRYSGIVKLFMLEDNLNDLKELSGGVYDRVGTSNPHMVKYKDSVIFSARADNNETHLFLHKGISSNPIQLFDPASLYGTISSIGGAKKFVATNQYLYTFARKDAGTFAYTQFDINTNDLSFSQNELVGFGDDFTSIIFNLGENFCTVSNHETSSEDLACYRAAQNDYHLIKTNLIDDVVGTLDNPGFNIDWSNHITSNLTEINNGSMNFRDYAINKDKLYFTARVDFDSDLNGGDFYGFELDLSLLDLRNLGSARDTAFLQYDATDTLVVANLSGQAGVVDLSSDQLLGYPLQTQISVGDGISSDSSNPKVIVDSKRFILFVRDDQALTSTPYTNDMEGDLYVYDRELDTTYTLNNPNTANPIVYEQSIPVILQKAFVKVMDQKAFIEVGVFNLGNNERTLLIFDLITGSYEFIELYDFDDPVDLEKILEIYKVGDHYVLYAKDNENSGRPVFFEITSANKLKPLAVEVTGTRTNPIVVNNMLYFLHNDSAETLYRIRDIGASLIKEQAGPAGLTLPSSVFWKFTTDNENFYFNIDNSGEKLYYINIETPLTNGYVLDETNAQVTDQTFLFKKDKLYTTDVTLISKPLYLIDTSSGTPIAKVVETIEQEYFFNGANDPVYKVGNQIKRIDKDGEIVDYIDTFDQYSDPVCNSLAFASLPSDSNFIFKEGALIYRDNGAGADDLCFYGVNGDSINFGSFGYNVNGLEIGVIADLGERVFFAISRPSNQVDLISMDTNDSSFVVLESNVTLFSEKPAGLKLNNNTIYYCDENLYAIDIASNTSDLINESFQCDPRTFHVSSSQSGIMLSGMDRDNYVGYELYEVR